MSKFSGQGVGIKRSRRRFTPAYAEIQASTGSDKQKLLNNGISDRFETTIAEMTQTWSHLDQIVNTLTSMSLDIKD